MQGPEGTKEVQLVLRKSCFHQAPSGLGFFRYHILILSPFFASLTSCNSSWRGSVSIFRFPPSASAFLGEEPNDSLICFDRYFHVYSYQILHLYTSEHGSPSAGALYAEVEYHDYCGWLHFGLFFTFFPLSKVLFESLSTSSVNPCIT